MKWVKPSNINGVLSAPPSKSYAIRAITAASFSNKETLIRNSSYCDDVKAAYEIAQSLGSSITYNGIKTTLTGKVNSPARKLDCLESGLCMRLFTPIAALYKKDFLITGSGSLKKRPMQFMEKPLFKLGVRFKTTSGYPPLNITGNLKNGEIELDCSSGSQFLSGLLFSLPLCEGDSVIHTKNPTSKPYIAMTLSVLNQFGISISSNKEMTEFLLPGNQSYQNSVYQVEGDWSGAAFLIVAAALKGKLSIQNLNNQSLQADKKIMEVLNLTDARYTYTPHSITVEKNNLKAFDFDATDCPDLFPPLVVLACGCKGKSIIFGANRLVHKESNRASVLISELKKIGANIKLLDNRMEIEGTSLKGGIIDSNNDHRIAMAGAVAGLLSKHGVGISNWEAVSKSYPGFFSDLHSVGGTIL